MRSRTDLEVFLLGSPGARRALFGLFLLSLTLDVEILLPVVGIRPDLLLHSWAPGTLLLLSGIEVAAIAGATILWYVMLYICLHDMEHSLGWRILWGIVFFLFIWWAAQVYYLFPFRQFGKPSTPAE
jgi:hypothetical protein